MMNIIRQAIENLLGNDDLKKRRLVRDVFGEPTPRKRGGNRHRPYTKPPMVGESKKRRQMAAKSRRINRQWAKG